MTLNSANILRSLPQNQVHVSLAGFLEISFPDGAQGTIMPGCFYSQIRFRVIAVFNKDVFDGQFADLLKNFTASPAQEMLLFSL